MGEKNSAVFSQIGKVYFLYLDFSANWECFKLSRNFFSQLGKNLVTETGPSSEKALRYTAKRRKFCYEDNTFCISQNLMLCLYPSPQIFDNTPAAKDGTLASGDELVGVAGQSVKGKTITLYFLYSPDI